jgi:hypothetical protein
MGARCRRSAASTGMAAIPVSPPTSRRSAFHPVPTGNSDRLGTLATPRLRRRRTTGGAADERYGRGPRRAGWRRRRGHQREGRRSCGRNRRVLPDPSAHVLKTPGTNLASNFSQSKAVRRGKEAVRAVFGWVQADVKIAVSGRNGVAIRNSEEVLLGYEVVVARIEQHSESVRASAHAGIWNFLAIASFVVSSAARG